MRPEAVAAEVVAGKATLAVGDIGLFGEGGVDPGRRPLVESGVAAFAVLQPAVLKRQGPRIDEGGTAAGQKNEQQPEGQRRHPPGHRPRTRAPVHHRPAPRHRLATGSVGERPAPALPAGQVGARAVPAVVPFRRPAFEIGPARTIGAGPDSAGGAFGLAAAGPGLVGPGVGAGTEIEFLQQPFHDTPPPKA